MPERSQSFRRPWIFKSIDEPDINYVWLAEYMAQHNLTMEVALEHLSHKMREFLEKGKEVLEQLDGSNPDLLKNCEVFVGSYQHAVDFYSPIPLVPFIKEE